MERKLGRDAKGGGKSRIKRREKKVMSYVVGAIQSIRGVVISLAKEQQQNAPPRHRTSKYHHAQSIGKRKRKVNNKKLAAVVSRLPNPMAICNVIMTTTTLTKKR